MVQRCHAQTGRASAIGGDCQYESGQQCGQCLVEYSLLLGGSGAAVYAGDVGYGGLFYRFGSVDIGGVVYGCQGEQTA